MKLVMGDLQGSSSRNDDAGTFRGKKGENLEHIMHNIYCISLAVKGKRRLEDLERVSGLNKNFLLLLGREELCWLKKPAEETHP